MADIDTLAAAIKKALYARVPGHAVTPAKPSGEWLQVGRVRLNVDVLCADIAEDLIDLFELPSETGAGVAGSSPGTAHPRPPNLT